MVDVERSKLESVFTLLWLSMVGIAVVALFVCVAALFATIEFFYCGLIAAPIASLLSRLAFVGKRGRMPSTFVQASSDRILALPVLTPALPWRLTAQP